MLSRALSANSGFERALMQLSAHQFGHHDPVRAQHCYAPRPQDVRDYAFHFDTAEDISIQ
jgi:hypothetical protein